MHNITLIGFPFEGDVPCQESDELVERIIKLIDDLPFKDTIFITTVDSDRVDVNRQPRPLIRIETDDDSQFHRIVGNLHELKIDILVDFPSGKTFYKVTD